MPSDCQCNYCSPEPKVTYVSDKETKNRLRKLEKRLEKLEVENIKLRRKLKKSNRPLREIVNDLIKYLNKYID